MLAGHVGVAVGLKRVDARLNLGVLVLACLWLDVLLWSFALAGLEQVVIPPDYATRHVLAFTFPYSHTAVAALAWAAAAALVAGTMVGGTPALRRRSAAVVAVAVLSHWVLDAVVHDPGLPLGGASSTRIGIGLWDRMPVALALEAAIALGGLALGLRGLPDRRGRRAWTVLYVLAILAMTVVGQTVAPAPPGATQVAASSLLAIAAMVAVAFRLDRRDATEGRAAPRPAASPLDPFIPRPDVRERFEITIEAPAALVMEVAADFDMQSIPLVRAIIRLREKLLHADPPPERVARGLLAETRGLGWGLLVDEPGKLIVCGAQCQPWLADPGFTAIPADRFAAHAEPDRVKIAWTLEAQALSPTRTRFAQETRVVATDAASRRRFRRYWRWARFGIIGIRLLLLPAIRRAAEGAWSGRRGSGAQ